MRLLLDTHTFLWAASDPAQLGDRARALILDPTNERLLSVASAWEMSIKHRTGKLRLEPSPHEFIAEQLARLQATVLPIELRHLVPVASLPLHHRDPFDRLLIAQALVEGIPLLSRDPALDAYEGLVRVW